MPKRTINPIKGISATFKNEYCVLFSEGLKVRRKRQIMYEDLVNGMRKEADSIVFMFSPFNKGIKFTEILENKLYQN